jgi:hypothetical protein
MALIQGRYPLEYRSEIVRPLMLAVQQGGSACVVGLAGAGKSNLVHFLEQAEIREQYLPPEEAKRTHFISITCDCGNQGRQKIFEDMLARAWLVAKREGFDLAASAPTGASQLPTLRNFLRDLCGTHGQRLIYMFDEFEELIRHEPAGLFDELMALRYDHRASGNLVFLTITHRMPHLVPSRSAFGTSKFFEILRSHIYPLPPYRPDDARYALDAMLRKLDDLEIAPEQREQLIAVSGGHSGLLKAVLMTLSAQTNTVPSGPADRIVKGHVPSVLKLITLVNDDGPVRSACEHIWTHLHVEEQQALCAIVRHEGAPREMASFLQRRGLLRNCAPLTIFCPLLAEYVRHHA